MDDGVKIAKKQTLLQKYDIPIERLNFEYVEKCNDEKELEKIVRILRSGEEGLYPQLVAAAEARLRKLNPDSRLLRTEEPVLRKETTSSEQWDEVSSEIEKWSDEMRAKEKEIKLAASEPMDMLGLPAVRSKMKVTPSTKSASATIQSQVAPPKRSPVPRDYSVWEKYDVDKELTMMEIEEQKQKEERERREREQHLKLKRLEEEARKAVKASPKPVVPAQLTVAEREVLATREKDKGNEFFKVADYDNAVKHYSASLEILPTPAAYNNRAIAMLKLHRYDAALKDCNEVLKVEPNNVKALMRRAIAHQNRNSFQKAHDDFSRVVELQPENRLAKSLANQMKTKCNAKRKGVRMKIEEESSSSQSSSMSKRRAFKTAEEKPQETEKEPWKPPPLPDKVLEAPWGGRMNPPLREGYNNSWPYGPQVKGPLTEYGLPKNFCNCTGEPPYLRHPPQIICLMCHERKVLGLPPLPDGDCNCPKLPPPPQPAENDVTDEGKPTNDGSGPSQEQEICEKMEEEELQEATPEEATPEKVTPEEATSEEASPEDTSDRLSTEEATPPPAPETTRVPVRRRRVIQDPDGSFIHIPGLGSPVKMNVAPKYLCSTKREVKEEAKIEVYIEQEVGQAQENSQNGDGLQKVEALGQLSLNQVPKITSPYEFTKAWGSTKPDASLEGYARVLKGVAPEDLSCVIGTKLDGPMLSLMLRAFAQHFLGEPEYLSRMMHYMSVLPRISIVWAFLDSADKEAVQKILSTLENSEYKLSPAAEETFKL